VLILRARLKTVNRGAMKLSDKDLRRVSKELLEREKELLYGEGVSTEDRIATLERFIVEQEKKLGSDDSKKTSR